MEEIELKGLKEVIYYDKVLDKLPVYIWQNQKVNGVFSALCVNYGSIHQEFKLPGEKKYRKVPKGIAHFIEHLNFYEGEETTANDFYCKYGSEVNAFTTFDYTCYHVYSTTEINENINHLLEFVLTPHFTKKMVNKERNIIIEELRGDLDSPETQLYFGNYENLFHKYKYKDTITGTESDVKNTTIDDIKLVYEAFYHPENMFLVVTGNVNPYDIVNVVSEKLALMKFDEYKKPILKKYKEVEKVVCEEKEIFGNVETPKVMISFKTALDKFKEIPKVELRLIVSLILNANFGPTSDLKELLMEKDLISYLGTRRQIIDDYLIVTITLESKYYKEAIKYVLKKLSDLTISEKTLKRKINASVASLVLNYDDIVGVNNSIQEDVLSYNQIISDAKEHLENINLVSVNKVIKELNIDNTSITILRPSKKA